MYTSFDIDGFLLHGWACGNVDGNITRPWYRHINYKVSTLMKLGRTTSCRHNNPVTDQITLLVKSEQLNVKNGTRFPYEKLGSSSSGQSRAGPLNINRPRCWKWPENKNKRSKNINVRRVDFASRPLIFIITQPYRHKTIEWRRHKTTTTAATAVLARRPL